MRLLRYLLAFSVSVIGLIDTHKADADVHCLPGQKAVEIGRDFHRCDPVAWICKSQGPNGHPRGQGWSNNRERASQRALAECTRRPGGQACSSPTCSSPGAQGATTAKQRLQPCSFEPGGCPPIVRQTGPLGKGPGLQPCSFDWGGCPSFRQTGPNGQDAGLQYTTTNTRYFHRPGSKFFPKGPSQQ